MEDPKKKRYLYLMLSGFGSISLSASGNRCMAQEYFRHSGSVYLWRSSGLSAAPAV